MKTGHATIIEAYDNKTFTLIEAKKVEGEKKECPKGWTLPPPPPSSSMLDYCCPLKTQGKHYNLIKVNNKPYCFPHKHSY